MSVAPLTFESPQDLAPDAAPGPVRLAHDVLSLCRRATQFNQQTPARRGNVIELSAENADDVFISADLHGHWQNYWAILEQADLERHPRRHLILQEVCHGGPKYRPEACASHAMLEAVAELKTRYPDRVHFLLSNHELSETTGHAIRKDGRMLLLGFLMGVHHRYGAQADAVHTAYTEFISSCPLAVRINGDVFVSHSAPEHVDLEGFDASVFDRPLEPADMEARGAAFDLVWGRDYRRENAEAFAELVSAKWLVHGHTPCDAGHNTPNELQLILDCTAEPATCLLVPAAGVSSFDELLAGLRPLHASPAAASPSSNAAPVVETAFPASVETASLETASVETASVETSSVETASLETTSVETITQSTPAAPSVSRDKSPKKEYVLANINESLQEAMKIDGALAAALVDSSSGMCLGAIGNHVDLEVAAAGNTEVVRAKLRVMSNLKLNDKIEDILISLGKEYHIIRMLERDRVLFLYLILRRETANLALARRKLQTIEKDLTA